MLPSFRKKISSPKAIAKNGLDILSFFPQTKDVLAIRIITEEQIDQSMSWDFFDGASQDRICGGGDTFFLNQNHHFQIQMGLGAETNNVAELIALKILLCFALEKKCRRIQIFGDSIVVINQVNKVQICTNISLISLFEEFIRLMTNFDYITCQPMYRERNSNVDHLSKKGLMMEHGTWKFVESRDVEVFEFYHRAFIDLQQIDNTT